jgi:hypothetical protein
MAGVLHRVSTEVAMASRRTRREPLHPVPNAPDDPAQPTRDAVPRRRYGGQEYPDEVQDRPEQNAGYDEAVRGETTAPGQEPVDALVIEGGDERGVRIRQIPDELPTDERPAETPDDQAERDVLAEVRRRERRR